MPVKPANPPSSAPLTPAEKKRLDNFFRQNSGDISSFEMLDGVLAAVLSCPEMVLPSDLMEHLPRSPHGTSAFRTIEQAESLLGLVMRHWNTVARALIEQDPFNPALDPAAPPADAGRAWAAGYQLGISIRPGHWRSLREHPFYGPMLRSILWLGGDTLVEPRMAMMQELSGADERPHRLAVLGYNVSGVHRFLRPETHAPREDWPEGDADDFVEPEGLVESDLWMGWGLGTKTVARIFSAAARFHRAAPWSDQEASPVIELIWPNGEEWGALVLGGPDMLASLSLYADPEDLFNVMTSASLPEAAEVVHGLHLNLLFVARDDLSREQVKEIQAHGWEVAGHDAYPDLAARNLAEGALTEELAERLIQALTGLAREAEEFAAQRKPARRKRRRPVEFTWQDPDTGLQVRGERT